jgi:hypothetical protein
MAGGGAPLAVAITSLQVRGLRGGGDQRVQMLHVRVVLLLCAWQASLPCKLFINLVQG